LAVNWQIESCSAPEAFEDNHTAQQVGQRERRLARFLSCMSLAAAALPWSLDD